MTSFGLFYQMVQDIDTRSMQTVFKPGLNIRTSWMGMFQNWQLNDFDTHAWMNWLTFVNKGRSKRIDSNRLDITEYKEGMQSDQIKNNLHEVSAGAS